MKGILWKAQINERERKKMRDVIFHSRKYQYNIQLVQRVPKGDQRKEEKSIK